MAKKSSFVCQNCGAVTQRWQGKCEACGEWNSIVEEGAAAGIGAQAARLAPKGRVFALEGLTGENRPAPRIIAGMAELDRVTGGGFVPGSVILMGGEPGIGKSTLLIQAAALMARGGHRVVYVSGEEAVAQVRLRAARLDLSNAAVELAAQTNVEDIVATLSEGRRPALVVIDSIQTMWTDLADSTPGTVTQVRSSAQSLIRFAKTTGATVILVGHVTKDGQIAGPRVVEHMVDAVLSFEGDGSHHFRILRAVKNRFGPTDEIGVFEMTGLGAGGSEQSIRHVPGWPGRAGVGRGGVCGHGGHAPDARGISGPGGPNFTGHAAPGRRRLGSGAAVHGDSRAGDACRAETGPARHLP